MKKTFLSLILFVLSISSFAQTILPAGSKIIGNQIYQSPSGDIFISKGSPYSPNSYFRVLSASDVPPNSLKLYGKKIVIDADSYGNGLGTSDTLLRWSTRFVKSVGGIEVNRSVPGTTIQKRSPIDYMASPNMVDKVTSAPTYSSEYGLYIIAFGLNDMGYNGGSYSTSNYITDYNTILTALFAKGWPANKILLIPPYYVGATGYASYASLTGVAAPTRTRHLSFVDATNSVATNNRTLYFNIFDAQIKADTTLMATGGIHANDAGNAQIANFILQYINGKSLKTGNIIANDGRFQGWDDTDYGDGKMVQLGIRAGTGNVIFYDRTIGEFITGNIDGSIVNINTVDGGRLNIGSDTTNIIGELKLRQSLPTGGTSDAILTQNPVTGAIEKRAGSSIPTVIPSALTKIDDTNVTLTLGGSPSTSLLQPVSFTLGWTGTLSDSRIASAATWNAKAPIASPTFTGTVTAPTFAGALTGNATSATSAGTVTTAAQPAITSVGTLASLTVTAPIAGSITGNAATVTTNANLTGEVTSIGNAATVTNAAVISKVLTGFTSGAGTVAPTDNILQAVQKLDGNMALKANLNSPTFTGTVTVPSGSALGTPASLVGTNISGTASALNIGGNAATATNSLKWNNAPYGGIYAAGTLSYYLAYNSTTAFYEAAPYAGLGSLMGLGTNAYTSTSYAPLASPTFTGVPSAPTAAPGTNSTQIATMAALQAALSATGATSGTYYPTMSASSHVGTPIIYKAHWQRIGNEVEVKGHLQITTTSSFQSVFQLDLPSGLTSDFTDANDDLSGILNGMYASGTSNMNMVNVTAHVANNTFQIGTDFAPLSANLVINYSITYTIK